MLIDSHQHVFWHGRDDADLITDMDEHGIDIAWLLTWEIGPTEDHPTFHRVLNPEHLRPDGTHGGAVLSDILRARARYPRRFIVGYCPHPLRGDAPGLLEAAYHMHDARVCGEWKFRVPFDDPRCLNLYRKAGELGMPVVLHLDVPYLPGDDGEQSIYQPNWYGGTIDHLTRALKACPRTNFVGHAPGFWREISGNADQDAATYPTGPIMPGGRLEQMFQDHYNLYADLSAGSALRALKRDIDYSRALLTRFADRFLFGRDYFGGELLTFLQDLSLDNAAWSAISRENAERLIPTHSVNAKPKIMKLS